MRASTTEKATVFLIFLGLCAIDLISAYQEEVSSNAPDFLSKTETPGLLPVETSVLYPHSPHVSDQSVDDQSHFEDISHINDSVVASEQQADDLVNTLEDFLKVFQSEPGSRPSSAGKASSPLSQSLYHSSLRSSMGIVLNHVWLATTCQYVYQKDFAQALEELELEKSVILAELENVTVAYENPDGSITPYRDDPEIQDFKQKLETAAKQMRKVRETGLCNNVTTNELINSFEHTMKEINSMQSTFYAALEALNVQKQESKATLQEIQVTFEDIKSQSVQGLVAMESQRKQVLQAMDSQKKLTSLAVDSVASQTNFTKLALEEVAKLREAHRKQEDQWEKMEEQLLPLIGDPLPGWIQSIQTRRTDQLARFATNPITSILVANHIQAVVSSAYSNNASNLDAILTFVEKLPDKKLAYLAYRSMFASMNHNLNWWGSVRLVYKLQEMSQKYNESASPSSYRTDEPSFRNFLQANVHPDFLRIMSGEFFNLESSYYTSEYIYLGQFSPTSNILYNAATLKVTPGGRRQDRWLWQLLPVPGDSGNRFFLRSKAHSSKPLRLDDSDYIRIEPDVPIVRTPGADHPSQIVLYIRRVLTGTYHYPSQQPNTDRRLVGRDIIASAGRSDMKKWVVVFPLRR